MPYSLGLPAWAYSEWNNRYFSSTPSALASYASVFNTVEGNTTFYHIPDQSTVEKWHLSVADKNFKFCFKFPKSITHQTNPSYADLDLFLQRIEPLKEHLGPFLLQFPATVGAKELSRVESVLQHLPANYRCALEVRHEDFFRQPELLENLLSKHLLGLVMMDTRAIFDGNRKHPEVLAALHKKPDLPVLGNVYNNMLFVRLLLHPDLISNDNYIQFWANRTAKALSNNIDCYLMIHCPNNLHCPELALTFHNKLLSVSRGIPNFNQILSPLPDWPVPQQTKLL